MLPWQNEVKQLQEQLKQLQIKLEHPHLTKSAEDDMDLKSKVIELQNRIIEIYIRETDKLINK